MQTARQSIVIDYGTYRIYEEHDIIELLEKNNRSKDESDAQLMKFIMVYFRGCINPNMAHTGIIAWKAQ
jgi:hypothetical protein